MEARLPLGIFDIASSQTSHTAPVFCAPTLDSNADRDMKDSTNEMTLATIARVDCLINFRVDREHPYST